MGRMGAIREERNIQRKSSKNHWRLVRSEAAGPCFSGFPPLLVAQFLAGSSKLFFVFLSLLNWGTAGSHMDPGAPDWGCFSCALLDQRGVGERGNPTWICSINLD